MATRLIRPLSHNYTNLLVSKAYGATTAGEGRQALDQAQQLACAASPAPACEQGGLSAGLLLVDDYYLDHPVRLYVITDTVELAAAGLPLGGRSELIQVTDDTVTMFGEGTLSARLFLMADGVEEWTIAVTAVHDAPAPVILEIWLDGGYFGTLSFDKGDQSWETLSVTGKITPRFHWLTLSFVNDYLDAAAGLDRNAYIRQITITRSGDR